VGRSRLELDFWAPLGDPSPLYARHVSDPHFLIWRRPFSACSLLTFVIFDTSQSGVGKNMKVGAPVRSESGGTAWSGANRRENFFGRAPLLFGAKSTISRFGERFCDDQ